MGKETKEFHFRFDPRQRDKDGLQIQISCIVSEWNCQGVGYIFDEKYSGCLKKFYMRYLLLENHSH